MYTLDMYFDVCVQNSLNSERNPPSRPEVERCLEYRCTLVSHCEGETVSV